MSVLNRITALLKERGLQQKALCDYIGIKSQAYTNWKNGSSDSYMKYLPEIAAFFGVSVDYLLGNPSPVEASLLPADLLEIIATLSDEEIKELRNYLRFLICKRN